MRHEPACFLSAQTLVAGADRPAPGNLDAGPRRQCAARAGASAGHPASALWRSLAGNAGRSRRRGHFRWPDERERPRTISFAARSTGSPCRYGSSGRSSEFASARRCWRGSLAPGWRRIRKAARRSDTIRSAPPPPAAPSARTGRTTSITGIARVLSCPRVANCWRREAISRSKRSATGHSFGFQFHPDVTYAMMHRWTARGHERFDLPGARPRHHHFADRAVHDVTERAWLKEFLDGWLARTPLDASERVMAQAAE